MPDESTGFEPEPFNLAALAGQEQLQERIRELENERAGKVLVDPEDLRAILNCADFRPMQWSQALQATVARLSDAAGAATEAGVQ